MSEWFEGIKAQFILNFIEESRWKMLLTGLKNTLIITILAAIIGVVIGIVIASIRTTYDNNKESMKRQKTFGYHLLAFFNMISKVYLTIIRGTP